MFNTRVANEIYKIKLDLPNHRDKWYWLEEVSKNFSVRNAYKLFQNLQREENCESSNANDHNAVWKMI